MKFVNKNSSVSEKITSHSDSCQG